MTTLGFFKDISPLLADHRNESRKFKTSHIVPYSANIAFTLYACRDNQNNAKNTFKVKMFVNEKATVIPGCDSMLCAYDTFKAMYVDLITDCDLAKICSENVITNGSQVKAILNFRLCSFILLLAAMQFNF